MPVVRWPGLIYEWFAPHLGMEPNYDEIKDALRQ